MSDVDHFRWGILLIECLKAVLPKLPPEVAVVDYEVIPPFDGRPDDMFVWLICSTKEAKALFSDEVRTLATRLLRAVDTLKMDKTSLTEIEEGGGRFYFFR